MFTAALIGTIDHLVCPQPAVDLLRDCPLVGRSSTNFLLLQAGDLRDVLYTIHNQSGMPIYEDHNYQFVVSEPDPIRLGHSISTSRIRLAWRSLRDYSACGSSLPQVKISAHPEDLARFMAKWYYAIFYFDHDEKAAARKEYTKPYYKDHLQSNRLAHRSVHYAHSIIIGLLCMIRARIDCGWAMFRNVFSKLLGGTDFCETLQNHTLELETLLDLAVPYNTTKVKQHNQESSTSTAQANGGLAEKISSFQLPDIPATIAPTPGFLVIRSTSLISSLDEAAQSRQSVFLSVTVGKSTHTFTAVSRFNGVILAVVPSQPFRPGKVVRVALLTTKETFRDLTDGSTTPSARFLFVGNLVNGVSKDAALSLLDHHPLVTEGANVLQSSKPPRAPAASGASTIDGSTVFLDFSGRGIQEICVDILAGSVVAGPTNAYQGRAPLYERLSPFHLRISHSVNCSAKENDAGALIFCVKGSPVLVYDSKSFVKRPFPVVGLASDIAILSLGSINVFQAPKVNVLSVRDKTLMYLSSMASITGSAVGASPVPMPDFMFKGGLILEELICRTHFSGNATGQDNWYCFQLTHVDTSDRSCGRWTNTQGQQGLRTRCDSLVVVHAIKHDSHGGMVFVDGYLITIVMTDDIVARFANLLQQCNPLSIAAITMNETSLQFCKHLMPAAVERCRRTWKHLPDCEYTRVNATIPLSTKNGESPICSCGMGKDIDDLPSVVAEQFGKYATRIALPLLYQPSYKSGHALGVMHTQMTDHGKQAYEITRARAEVYDRTEKACTYCGTTKKEATMKTCFDCDKVIYCNNACKAKDMKHHKKKCGEERPWVKYLPSEEQKAKLPIEGNEEIRKMQPLRRYGWI
ncbi:hypothetical protein KVT40_004415 [Elsinoe batatas]|uniref:MYND-type domain-containing protein n=1 Tax=Elsinoe batatas TaxID=2601811 RepID=A0A8K0L3Y5_9PEZI|nr:hypothetical protein KVT40_004415 [Elsinoe batatas]